MVRIGRPVLRKHSTICAGSLVSHLAELSDIQTNAVRLHAVAQGASVIYEACCAPRSDASNALHSVLEVIIDLADRLATDLDRLETRMKS